MFTIPSILESWTNRNVKTPLTSNIANVDMVESHVDKVEAGKDGNNYHDRKPHCSQGLKNSKWSDLLKTTVPILILGLTGYIEYCYCYRFCYLELRQRDNRVAGLVLLVICNVLLMFLLVIWIQIMIVGPGSIDIKIPPYDLSRFISLQYTNSPIGQEQPIKPPDWFVCNLNGLPFWCSQCQSIKIFRSHHSSDTSSCVPRFDHYCYYIGSVIGLKNYKLFILFLVTVFIWFLFIVISVACFLSEIKDYRGIGNMFIINPNLIVLLMVSIFWMLMTGALLASHFSLINKNMTTVESLHLDKRRTNSDGKRFVNFIHPSGESNRIVMEIDSKESPYDNGFYHNACDLFGSQGVSLLLPFNVNCSNKLKGSSQNKKISKWGLNNTIEQENKQISDEFKKNILHRFEMGEGILFDEIHRSNQSLVD